MLHLWKRRLFTPSAPSTKTAPLALTTGFGGRRTSGSGRTSVIQYLPPAAQRVRLTIRNWNPRYVFADQRAVALTEVKIGRHTGDGRGTGWVELQAGATAYDSGWTDVPASFRGAEIVLQYRWEGRDVVRCLGTGWTDGVRDPFPPLFSWFEVEVPTSTPVVAVFGSSTAAGVGAERPLIDSWFGLWAREHGVVPMFVAHSGDKALSWSSVSDRKWSLYGDRAVQLEAVLYAMGSNDWAGRADLPALQERVEATIHEIRERTGAPIFGTTITPRRRRPPNEQTRIAYNEWLQESGLFAGVIDLAAAVSLPDGTLDPAVDHDGTHVNPLGHARLAAAVPPSVNRAVVSRRGGQGRRRLCPHPR